QRKRVCAAVPGTSRALAGSELGEQGVAAVGLVLPGVREDGVGAGIEVAHERRLVLAALRRGAADLGALVRAALSHMDHGLVVVGGVFDACPRTCRDDELVGSVRSMGPVATARVDLVERAGRGALLGGAARQTGR